MPVPSMVKFHITPTGPNRCRAYQIACPLDPGAPHYESYESALEAWGEQLEAEFGVFTPKKKGNNLSAYEDLLKPQGEDLGYAEEYVFNIHCFGDPPGSRGLHNLDWDHRLCMVAPDFISMSDAQLKEYNELKAQVESALVYGNQIQTHPVSGYMSPPAYKLLKIVNAVRQPAEVISAYEEYYKKNARTNPKVAAEVEAVAANRARRRVFVRALEDKVEIPSEAAVVFERIWSADANTHGSQMFFESKLRSLTNDLNGLDEADDPDKFAETLGFADAKRAKALIARRLRTVRRYYRNRGRDYEPTVRKALRALDGQPIAPPTMPKLEKITPVAEPVKRESTRERIMRQGMEANMSPADLRAKRLMEKIQNRASR